MDEKQKKLWNSLLGAWNRDSIACQIHFAETYTKQYPKDMFGWIALADGLSRISSFVKAFEALHMARKLCPREMRNFVFSQTGKVYGEKGDHARAEHWHRKAVEDKESQENLVFLGACLAKQGKFSEAKEYHRKAAKLDQTTADEAYFNLGLILRAEGKYVEALRFFEKAIEIDPDYDEAKIAKADILQLFKTRNVKNNRNRKRKNEA